MGDAKNSPVAEIRDERCELRGARSDFMGRSGQGDTAISARNLLLDVAVLDRVAVETLEMVHSEAEPQRRRNALTARAMRLAKCSLVDVAEVHDADLHQARRGKTLDDVESDADDEHP